MTSTTALLILTTTIATAITVLIYPIDMRLAIALFFTWLLIIIAAIDCAHLIIPDPLNYILL
ncbi:MAG: hypothetical protein GY821_14695 [Gammaproteobacteria bacterium]|nr:hypothetical protein [Gammaproteobacteria bacterium]